MPYLTVLLAVVLPLRNTFLSTTSDDEDDKQNGKKAGKTGTKNKAKGRKGRGNVGGDGELDLEGLIPDEVLVVAFTFLGSDIKALCQAACVCRRSVIR